MDPENARRVASILGLIVLVLAWSAAAIEYTRTGEIQWPLVAAGVVFAVLPFATAGVKTPPTDT